MYLLEEPHSAQGNVLPFHFSGKMEAFLVTLLPFLVNLLSVLKGGVGDFSKTARRGRIKKKKNSQKSSPF